MSLNITPELIAAAERLQSEWWYPQYAGDKRIAAVWVMENLPKLAEIERAARELRGHAWLVEFRKIDSRPELTACDANEIAAYVDRLLDLIKGDE
jgi:hypothetical protein